MGVVRGRRPTYHHHGCGPSGAIWVRRQFVADRPDKLWLSDITYLPTNQGCVYV